MRSTVTTLRVIVDQIVAPLPGGIGRYTEELTRELIRTAPAGIDVAGIVSSSSAENYDLITTLLPGLAELQKSPLPRRELELAWRFGATKAAAKGMIHGTGLFAPLGSHNRHLERGQQIAVTIHDTLPWSHPESFAAGRLGWYKAMIRRAERFADAVVVPTHAVAEQLQKYAKFGERIRVIGGAVSPKLALPVDPDARAARLELPERYIFSAGTIEPRKGTKDLIQALALPELAGIPLLIAGPVGWQGMDVAALAAEAGLAENRVRALGVLPDADLAVALDRAAVFAYPSRGEGFGLPVVEAFSFGTPVVHSNDPAIIEVSAGAGVAVDLEGSAPYSQRLATAIARVLGDSAYADERSVLGTDRARAFSWKDSAQQVWQLHADL